MKVLPQEMMVARGQDLYREMWPAERLAFHMPSPMGFLSQILGRPENERPFILFPVGYPADEATVPLPTRKSLDEVSVWDPGLDNL
jgi:hypothetical protein